MYRFAAAVLLLLLLALAVSSCGGGGAGSGTPPAQNEESLDTQLRFLANINRQSPLDPGPTQDPLRVELGRALFFDKELSGNRDTSCATCHQLSLGSSDGLPISIGTGGRGVGGARVKGEGRRFHPRNSPDLFNRGARGWNSAFWDSRVFVDGSGQIKSFAGDQAPPQDNMFELQTMFPFTARDEMRGFKGDTDVFGQPNELAEFGDEDFTEIWAALTERLMAIHKYRQMFAEAFPDVREEDIDFSLAGKAIAAFIFQEFGMANTPWDRYLAGNNYAMNEQQKRGAMIFLSKGRCVECHSGSLLTDQQHHNLVVPHIGPGPDLNTDDPLDYGRVRISGDSSERFAFRTPPLRNVAVTGPYMHNGAFNSLEDAVRHHLDCYQSALNYNPSQLRAELRPGVLSDQETVDEMMETVAPQLAQPIKLAEREIDDLLAFLSVGLTDPACLNMQDIRPASVPSGMDMVDE